jgi:hypothetical protein
VTHGGALLAFTDAVMAQDAEAIVATRDAVAALLGPVGVSEAAGIMTMFNVVDRIADATGIPIDEGFIHDMRYGIGSELGMDHLTPEVRSGR